jgi:hypothetical protein
MEWEVLVAISYAALARALVRGLPADGAEGASAGAGAKSGGRRRDVAGRWSATAAAVARAAAAAEAASPFAVIEPLEGRELMSVSHDAAG